MSATAGATVTPPASTIWQGAVLLITIGILYRDVLARLVEQWWTDPNFSHGFFVPAFSAMIIWWDRDRLLAIPARPTWLGLVVIVGALSVLTAGVLGSELFLSRSSLIFLLAGMVLHFGGWAHLRALVFPVSFLFLMIPIPTIIFNQIAFPLQLLASQFAAAVLQISGVPTLRMGNVIQLPVMTLEVVEACSGIRSLVTLMTLAIIYGYLLEPVKWKRVVLALSSIPIAVIANALRIVGTGLLGEYWEPDKAQGFFHSFSGWMIFVASLLMLYLLHATMQLTSKLRRKTA